MFARIAPGLLEYSYLLAKSPLTEASIEVNSRYFQNSFQVVVIEKLDFNGAAALMVTEHHFGAEPFLDFILHRRQMGILIVRGGVRSLAILFAALLFLMRKSPG